MSLSSLLQRVTSHFIGRYYFLKLRDAFEAGKVRAQDLHQQGRWRPDNAGDLTEKAREAANQQIGEAIAAVWYTELTYPIKFTGPAMMPALNRSAKDNPHSVEILCARRIWKPTVDNVRQGDVVLCEHPLANNLLVRRVLALPAQVVSNNVTDHVLGPDVVWVGADNPELDPPHVEDSRTFGPLPLDKIRARCIYAFRSAGDHSTIKNHSDWEVDDQVICDQEIHDDWQITAARAIAQQDNAGSRSS